MRLDDYRAVLARLLGPCTFVIASLAFVAAPAAFAKDNHDETDEQEEVTETEEIVVTGSRLKRDTYSSIAPLQIITGQVSREVGLIDTADILQESTASSGQQIDLTFSGFVLDNGPAASTINLRGLGEARTLVLVNGRRLAPAGVEGAPFAPDLNLVPASLVQQYDLLLDGASSVYGSDAVAGVANIILRKDFDGLEIENYTSVPEHANGVETTMSVVYGRNFDRGFFGIGVEYTDSENVRVGDRPWTAGCDKHYEVDQFGNFRTEEQFYTNVYGMDWDECKLGLLAARVSVPFAGSIYYTPGFQQSPGSWVNFSESSLFGAIGVDGDGNSDTDINFRDYDLNGKDSQQNADMFPSLETTNAMAYGEYTFDGDANITPYFEAMYAETEFLSNSSEGQLFPSVAAGNPFNPCNPAAVNGVDCGDAWDALMNNPNFVNQVLNTFGCDPSAGGSCDQTVGPIGGAAAVTPIVSVRGDRNFTAVEGSQIRLVGGVRGDMPWLQFGTVENWSFDLFYSYSKSDAWSDRQGVRGDRLDLALGNFSTTGTPCVNDTGEVLADDVAPGCVPVNLFAPSLHPVGVVTGDFETQAERDYLFDGRNFDTDYEQTVIGGYITGDIFDLPAGSVALGLGFETRNDDIASIPDAVARDGLFFGFFNDGGATGDKDTDELFAEVLIPIVAGKPGFEELTLEMSTRYTDDEIYGSGNTESFKLGWRPVESLLLRGTFGTSFRAPNLRELFLQAQSGFNNALFDPCFIPDAAIDPISGGYNPALDDREPEVLANCIADGVDPTLANNNGFNSFSVEVQTGGATDLFAETSESWSAGFAWDQPFTNAFDFSLSVTYFEIEVENTIVEPTSQFIVNDCYNSTTGNSAFCSRITRDLSDPTSPVITLIDSGFLNREAENARGLDVNFTFTDTWTIAERPFDVLWDLSANRIYERSTLFIDDNGNPDFDTFEDEWGFPSWNFRSGMRVDYGDWRLTYETRYLAGVDQDVREQDSFSDAFTLSDTCLGPPSDVLCRDVGHADNYFLHHMSLFYYGDRWTFGGGIRNLLDEEPPRVDGTELTDINGAPLGYGYDLNGRTFFVNIAANFGGGE